MFERTLVGIPSCFESIFSETVVMYVMSVGPPFDYSFVDNRFLQTVVWYGAFLLLSAIATTDTITFFFAGSQDILIVLVDHSLHIFCSAVGHFNGSSVKVLVEL